MPKIRLCGGGGATHLAPPRGLTTAILMSTFCNIAYFIVSVSRKVGGKSLARELLEIYPATSPTRQTFLNRTSTVTLYSKIVLISN